MMKITLTENKLRSLIKESIIRHLNEEYDDDNIEDENDNIFYDNDFYYGFAIVEHNGKYNYIRRNGELLSNQWFDDAYDFDQYGYGKVYRNNKCNLIDSCGRLLSNIWVDNITFNGIYYAYPIAWEKGKCNVIYYGEILSPKWFDNLSGTFIKGYTLVEENGKWNFMDEGGYILSKQWFDDVNDFEVRHNNENKDIKIAGVKLNGKWNFINERGNILSKRWFDGVNYWNSGKDSTLVKIGNIWYVYDPINRKLLHRSEYQPDDKKRRIKKTTKLSQA